MSSYLEEQFGLSGETAVVVGGTGELCGTIAEGLAKAGAKVVIVGRSQEKADKRLAAIKEAGGQAIFIAADVTKKADLEKVAVGAAREFGNITIAVNGAGVNSATPFLEISDEEMTKILDANYKAVVFGSQVFGKAEGESHCTGNAVGDTRRGKASA